MQQSTCEQMTRAHSSDREYLTAKEAAAYLDIKLATLYAYTSRKLVNSIPADQGKGHLYRTSDLERLKQRHDARAGHVAAAAT